MAVGQNRPGVTNVTKMLYFCAYWIITLYMKPLANTANRYLPPVCEIVVMDPHDCDTVLNTSVGSDPVPWGAPSFDGFDNYYDE